MAAMQRGLGKGLDALLRGVQEAAPLGEMRELPLDAISPNPNQPRKEFPANTLQELADSIAAQGVIQPILVRKSPPGSATPYELVAGERRWRASRMAGKSHIPAHLKEIDDDTSLVIAIIENLQREDLNPVDEAFGLQQLQEQLSLSQEALAQKVGKSRPAVANSLRLLQLPRPIQEHVRLGRLSAGHGRALLAVDDPHIQEELLHRIKTQELSVREVEALVAWWRENASLPEGQPDMRPTRRTPSKATKAQDEHLVSLQRSLRESIPCKVAVRGSLDKGQIVLSFSSPEELLALRQRLGVTGDVLTGNSTPE